MTVKKIENTWQANFMKSPLIENGVFKPHIAHQLFYGPERNTEIPFRKGFRDFKKDIDNNGTEDNIDTLLQYLHFIGITISKEAVLDGIASEKITLQNITTKAFYLFKQLSSYDKELNTSALFNANRGDLMFFLKIAQGEIVF